MVKVGFLGTGLMGQAMAQRLLEVKVPVVAHNRTRSKLEPLKEALERSISKEDSLAIFSHQKIKDSRETPQKIKYPLGLSLLPIAHATLGIFYWQSP